MLVCAEVIHNAAALLAVNHVGIEPPRCTGFEVPDPRYSLSAEWVEVGVVPYRKRYRRTALREHDSPPASDIQKRQRKEFAVPKFVHDALADGGALILAAESKTLLNSRMQKLELFSERPFVNGSHAGFS